MSTAAAGVSAGMGKRKRFDTPAGGDERYGYVPFASLHHTDRTIALTRYVHVEEHLPDEEYLYPVKLDGRLALAKRHMPAQRAKELYEAYIVREIHKS